MNCNSLTWAIHKTLLAVVRSIWHGDDDDIGNDGVVMTRLIMMPMLVMVVVINGDDDYGGDVHDSNSCDDSGDVGRDNINGGR